MIDRFPFAAENLAPPGDDNRGPVFVDRELSAIGNNIHADGLTDGHLRIVAEPDRRRHRPKAIGLTEVGARNLPGLEHYHAPIRSTKTLGRANIALYVRDGLEGPRPEWFQHKATWPKVNDPTQRHAARATLIKEIEDGPTILVGHGPQAPRRGGPNPLPERTNDALDEARAEWVEDTTMLLKRYHHLIWLGDPNGLLDDVFRRLGDEKAAMGGSTTDAVLARGYIIDSANTPGSVNGVPMLTDHKQCLLGLAVRR